MIITNGEDDDTLVHSQGPTPQGLAREGLRKKVNKFISKVPMVVAAFTLVGILVAVGSCSVLWMNGLHSRIDALRDDVREDDDEIISMIQSIEGKLDKLTADLQAQADEKELEASAPGDL